MAEFDRIRAGLIGYGVGKLYAAALQSAPLYYPNLPPVDLVAVATASEASGQAAMRQFGFTRATTEYRELLASDDLNVIIITTPPYLHREMVLDTLRSDKALYIDKPLALNVAEAREIVDAAGQSGRDGQMVFEFRYCPAIQYARQLIADGRLGTLYTFRATYFRSSYADPQKPLGWKGSRAKSGGGVLNDYVPHLVDLVLWLVGMPERVAAQTRTYIAERPAGVGFSGRIPVDTDDHVIIQATLPGGTIGTIEAGRLVTGTVNDLAIEIAGSEGTLRWSLMDPNYLYLAERKMAAQERGWLQIPTVQQYPGAAIPGWDIPVGMMRFHIASIADFLRHTLEQRAYDPGLVQGLRVQSVIDAAVRSAAEGGWADVHVR